MAFGIGVNTERPDLGPLRGPQEDVACDCWFSSTGNTIPRMIKYQDKEGQIHRLEGIRVREIRRHRRCGISMVEYKCSVCVEGQEYKFLLMFHMEACQWKLIWENLGDLEQEVFQQQENFPDS
ncbi:MAG: hypothetical protein ACOYBE_06525 [Blautia sp.]